MLGQYPIVNGHRILIHRENRRLVTLTDADSFSQYLQRTEPHCPFLLESVQRRLCFRTTYVVPTFKSEEFERLAFFESLSQVALFKERRNFLSGDDQKMYCENLLFEAIETVSCERIVPWVHWILKLFYTEEKIIFGDFWKGEVGYSKRSKRLPVPPLHFLSIRSLHSRDKRFFSDTRDLTKRALPGTGLLKRRLETQMKHYGYELQPGLATEMFEECKTWASKALERYS